MAKNGFVLVGYNEDFIDLRTALWLFPAGDKIYGRILWGKDGGHSLGQRELSEGSGKES